MKKIQTNLIYINNTKLMLLKSLLLKSLWWTST